MRRRHRHQRRFQKDLQQAWHDHHQDRLLGRLQDRRKKRLRESRIRARLNAFHETVELTMVKQKTDALTGGNICYSHLDTLTTGNFGEWRTDQSGVSSACDNVYPNSDNLTFEELWALIKKSIEKK